MPADQLGVTFDRVKIMQIRILLKVLMRCGFRKAFISDNDSFGDPVLCNKLLLRCCIQHVSWKYFGTYRFHFFEVKGKEDRYIACPFRPCLPGEI